MAVVIGCIVKTMQGRRNSVVELEEGARRTKATLIVQPGLLRQLRKRLGAKGSQKMPAIYAREAVFDVPSAPREIERGGHGSRSSELCRSALPLLTQPLQQHVRAE